MNKNQILNHNLMNIFIVFIVFSIWFLPNVNSADWWDTNYKFRERINVTTSSNSPFNGYENYTVQITVDTTNNNYFLNSGSDIRIIWWDGSQNFELDRQMLENNTNSTRIRFKLQDNITANSNDSNYYMYYSNPLATNPPSNLSNVYLWYDNASTNRISEYRKGRVDSSAHGGGWLDTISWNSAGYYEFDTGDNRADSLRPLNIIERDIYFEYEAYQTDAYPNDMTSGPMTRWIEDGGAWTPGGENSNHMYYYEMGESLIRSGSYSSHDDITADGRSGTIVQTDGSLGFFPTAAWTRLGIATWLGSPTVFTKSFYNNESGGFNGFRQSGSHNSNTNTGAGEFGLWVQQEGGRLDNLIARRYIEPEPSLNKFEQIKYSSNMSILISNASTTSENFIERNNLINITATVSCTTSFQNTCGNITINLKYNNSASTFTNIQTSTSNPVWTTNSNPQSCIALGNSNCTVSWLVNATDTIGTEHILIANASSNYSSVSSQTSDNINLKITGSFAIAFNQSSYSFTPFDKNSGNKKTNISVESILGDNTNLIVECQEGNCSLITSNWTNGIDLNENQNSLIEFTCSDTTSGNIWALYNLTSNEFNSSSNINVSCTINPLFGPISGSIEIPTEGTITQAAQNKTFTLYANMSCIGFCGNVSVLLAIERGKTGLTSTDPGDSGWQIKQDYPNSQSGTYWIQTEAMTNPEQIYIDMDYDGGGWMLVGRGREGWSFNDAQQGTFADVASIPTGTSAFSPDHYSSTFIDTLLNNTDVSNLRDGVRVRRANDTTGSTWQEGIWNFTSLTGWDWDWDSGGGFALSNYILDGIDYGAEDTRDARSGATDKTRTRTITDVVHNSQAGFQYGDNVCDGSNTPTNYLWEYIAECNSLPFTQIYIKPRYKEESTGKLLTTSNKPAYSLDNNPQFCTPTEDGSCNFNWTVNVTGDLGTDFNLTLIYVSNISSIDNNQSGIVTINITTDIPPTVTLLNPTNQSKIIGNTTQELTWRVEDNSANLNCSLYINNIFNQSLTCPSSTNTSINITFKPGFYTWKVMADDNISQVNSTEGNFWIIRNISSKISKKITSINTDMFKVEINVSNYASNQNRIIPTDFVNSKFNSGSLTPPFNLTNSISKSPFNGTLYSWNLSIIPLTNEIINYSITKNTNNYKLAKNYIIGLG